MNAFLFKVVLVLGVFVAVSSSRAQFRNERTDSGFTRPITITEHHSLTASKTDSALDIPALRATTPDSSRALVPLTVVALNAENSPMVLVSEPTNHPAIGALVGAGAGALIALATAIPHGNESPGEYGSPFASSLDMGLILYGLPLTLIGALIGSLIYY